MPLHPLVVARAVCATVRTTALTLSVGAALLVGCARGGGRGDAGSSTVRDAGPGLMGTDAGPQVSFDSGPPDTFPDAGPGMVGMDAGPPMMVDAGAPDAGAPDAGPGGSGLALTPGFMMTLNGNTTGGTTWARPLATICPASGTSSVGTAVPYATHEVRNASSGTLSVHVGSTASWDGYLVIYAGTSVPSDPLMCIEGDDDGGTGSDPDLTFSLAAGASALIVVSGFDNMDFGSYVLSIDAS